MSEINMTLVTGLVDANRALVQEATQAVDSFRSNPDPARSKQVRDWQEVVVKNLSDYLQTAETGARELSQGSTTTLAHLAGVELGLAKQMDGFAPTWATEAQQARLEELLDEVISRAMALHSHLSPG